MHGLEYLGQTKEVDGLLLSKHAVLNDIQINVRTCMGLLITYEHCISLLNEVYIYEKHKHRMPHAVDTNIIIPSLSYSTIFV